MPRADTMLAVLMLLRARKRMSARQLAEELEVSIRTVYRCIDALCAGGVPIEAETGREGGYAIPPHVRVDPLFFDPDEQKALLHAARLARDSGYPHADALDRAAAKIRRYNDAEQAERLAVQENRYGRLDRPADETVAAVLRAIERAADAQRAVSVAYRTGGEGQPTVRLFDPYGLVHWQGYWYAVGNCRLRGALRCLRADRIARVEPTDETFVRPSGFSPADALRNSLHPPADEAEDGLIDVCVEGSGEALDDLCGRALFLPRLAERAADRAVFRMDESTAHLYAVYQLLAYGGRLRVTSPASVRSHMAEIAEGLVREYGTPQ